MAETYNTRPDSLNDTQLFLTGITLHINYRGMPNKCAVSTGADASFTHYNINGAERAWKVEARPEVNLKYNNAYYVYVSAPKASGRDAIIEFYIDKKVKGDGVQYIEDDVYYYFLVGELTTSQGAGEDLIARALVSSYFGSERINGDKLIGRMTSASGNSFIDWDCDSFQFGSPDSEFYFQWNVLRGMAILKGIFILDSDGERVDIGSFLGGNITDKFMEALQNGIKLKDYFNLTEVEMQTAAGGLSLGGALQLRKAKEDKTFEVVFSVDADGNGRMKSLTTDKLSALRAEIIESLRSSGVFNPSFTGEGFAIVKDAGTGEWNMALDNLTVRKVMTVFEMVISKIRALNGDLLVTQGNGKLKSLTADDVYYYLTFSEAAFIAKDLLRCKTAGKEYWVECVSVTDKTVTVSKSDIGWYNGALPEVGDEIIQCGNSDALSGRNSAVYVATNDNRPRVEILQNIVSRSFVGCSAGVYGVLDGIYDTSFATDDNPSGALHGVGLYAPNIYATGEFAFVSGKKIETAISEAEAKAKAAQEALDAYKGIIDNKIIELEALTGDLQDQIDGNVMMWNGEEVPSLSNYPVNTWSPAEYNRHVGDIYNRTYSDNGVITTESYKFAFYNNIFTWVLVTDSQAAEAYQKAMEALGLAGSKSKCSIGTTPDLPCFVNDLWINSTNGIIYICNAPNTVFDSSNWQVANDAALRLNNIANDNIITKEEKVSLRNTWMQIQKEYSTYTADAIKYSIIITTLTLKYNAISAFLTNTIKINDTTDITLNATQKTTYNTVFAEYYCERTRFANEIAKKISADLASSINDDLLAIRNSISEEHSYIEGIESSLNTMGAKLDGTVVAWFYAYTPTAVNEPASNWNTEELKAFHEGDTFTCTSALNADGTGDGGKSWKWTKKTEDMGGGIIATTWVWDALVPESNEAKALKAATSAQDTADGKRRVFIAQPTKADAYDAGDLWTNATYGSTYSNDLLKCVTAKASGTDFNISHWAKATKYTDDTKANQALTAISQMNDDGIFDIVEKQTIRTQWEMIWGASNTTGNPGNNGSFKKTLLLAVSVGITDTDALDNAAEDLYLYLTDYKLYTDVNTSGFVRSDMASLFTAYYAAENALLDKISEKRVDDVQVGGRNLVLNSMSNPTTGYWKFDGWIGKEVVFNNNGLLFDVCNGWGFYYCDINTSGDIAISFDIRVISETNSVGQNTSVFQSLRIANYYGDYNQSINNGYIVNNISWQWSHKKIKFNSANSKIGFLTTILQEGIGSQTSFEIRNLKIEKGNKPTDWTPAPEDTDKQIAEIITEFSAKDGKIAALIKEISPTKEEIARTGIDIENRKINTYADKFYIMDSLGNPIAAFEMVDGTPRFRTDLINADTLVAKFLKTGETGVRIEAFGNLLQMIGADDNIKLLITGDRCTSLASFVNSSGAGGNYSISQKSLSGSRSEFVSDIPTVERNNVEMTQRFYVPSTGSYSVIIPPINISMNGYADNAYGSMIVNVYLKNSGGDIIKLIKQNSIFINENSLSSSVSSEKMEIALEGSRYYYIDYVSEFNGNVSFAGVRGSVTINTTAKPVSEAYVLLQERTNNTTIFENGLGYKASTTKYAVILNSDNPNDPVFEARCGKYAIKVGDSGVKIMRNGVDWTNL